jgi:argininosuccinate lyase
MFARRSLQSFAEARKDVLYDFMAREDLNWREAHARVAMTV